jgi:carbon-monoxide dehydrogenase large subunit
VVSLDLVNQRVTHSAIEPRSTLATYDEASGRLTILTSCQTPTGFRDELCDAVLKIPRNRCASSSATWAAASG